MEFCLKMNPTSSPSSVSGHLYCCSEFSSGQRFLHYWVPNMLFSMPSTWNKNMKGTDLFRKTAGSHGRGKAGEVSSFSREPLPIIMSQEHCPYSLKDLISVKVPITPEIITIFSCYQPPLPSYEWRIWEQVLAQRVEGQGIRSLRGKGRGTRCASKLGKG